MKSALALLPILLTGATTDNAKEKAVAEEAIAAEPIEPAPNRPDLAMPNLSRVDKDRCNDFIREVRREGGLPELQREPARPGDATLWSAVDRRIDGCAVLVAHGSPDDIRPVPKPNEDPLFRFLPVGD